MVTRVCISINNRCNLSCKYCHFHEKKDSIIESEMDVFRILDNIRQHIERNAIHSFKIGFVGNGEPMLEFDKLRKYIDHIADLLESGVVSAYTITNGVSLSRSMLEYLSANKVNVGFSIDGLKVVHDKWRCNSYDKVMQSIELYREVVGTYPSMNCTVGRDVLDNADETIKFFETFGSRITFSRMIGQYGISLSEFNTFLDKAAKTLNVRRGGYDCTMYGGMCGAGMNNIFYANGKIYVCGNCVDIQTPFSSDTPLDAVKFDIPDFDRECCYKESVLKR